MDGNVENLKADVDSFDSEQTPPLSRENVALAARKEVKPSQANPVKKPTEKKRVSFTDELPPLSSNASSYGFLYQRVLSVFSSREKTNNNRSRGSNLSKGNEALVL